MNSLVFLPLCFLVVLAAPGKYYGQEGDSYGPRTVLVKRPVIVTSQYHSQDENGQYNFGYASSDGQAKAEVKGDDGIVAGKYAYYDPKGNKVELSYVAGPDGFHADGEHLPKNVEALEVPEELRQAYEESNARLAQAYEEAKARGDTEEEEEAAAQEGGEGEAQQGGGEQQEEAKQGGSEEGSSGNGESQGQGQVYGGVRYITIPITTYQRVAQPVGVRYVQQPKYHARY